MAVASSEARPSNLLGLVASTPVAQTLRQRVEAEGILTLTGVSEAARSFVIALLHRLLPAKTVVAVVDSVKSQEIVHQDLQTWLGPEAPSIAKFYPAWDVLPNESRLPHADVISERLETLLALARHPRSKARVIVTTAVALQQRTFAPETLHRRTRHLTQGDRWDPLDLIEWLESQAYEPEAQVTQKGEIAFRGGIVDVFPLSSPWPVRLEFFGKELESLRFFDPQTQVSRQSVESISLPPAGELGLLRQSQSLKETAPGVFSDHLPPGSLFLLFDLPELARQAGHYAEMASTEPGLFVPWESALAAARTVGHSILEVESPFFDAMPAVDGAPAAAPALSHHRGDDPLPAKVTCDTPAASHLTFPLMSLELFRPAQEPGRDVQIAEQQRRAFFDQIHRWLRQGFQVLVFCNNDGERQRFCEIWAEYGLANDAGVGKGPRVRPRGTGVSPSTAFHPPKGLSVVIGALTRGFLAADARCVVITDSEIFGRYRVPRPRRLRSPHAAAMKSALQIDFTELEEGDTVVHLQHGIGRYLGLQLLPARSGSTEHGGTGPSGAEPEGQECLVLEYASSDPGQSPPRLYVPVTQAHLVSKYVGAGKARPPLNTLGGTRWAKAKAHANQAVQDLAAELLAIQAARDSQDGHAHGGDTPWQREFESAFLYEETPDQSRAIQETKTDMEKPRPMDRLICGDVGFGKTEVAVRAAFKAVMGGKQVAVLVPTTVLAQQHFNTFRERMADYPVRLELLSRFRTRRQQQAVLRDLQAGSVDIVIGTHRLVQSDVRFRDLGLVIVDEEQRFGVLQKERFKRLRRLVDVLTLSATPIPRTLYLALTGARDMSTIETPPQDRLPVQTLVTPYDERVIRDAILRELNRGGQVFFLHNRVTTIHGLAVKLQNLVPQGRLVIGHGQMPADELEEVMARFVNGDADILLSTTIIESGIDIPNANTIIIDRADRFGLSDLYQLRGRVGRYKHQAYAYFLLPRHAALLADARKRISAIRQYSSLGSGFKIAMRDLEIRGAGNLLGPEQSGHITAVGFELYCQLLQQSIARLKGEAAPARIDVSMRLDFLDLHPNERPEPPTAEARTAAHLPHAYLPEARHRIEFYRRLAQAQSTESLGALRRELRDRFGNPPDTVDRLFQVTELRILAAQCGVSSVETRGDRIMLSRQGDFITLGGKFPRLTRQAAQSRLNEIKKLLLALR